MLARYTYRNETRIESESMHDVLRQRLLRKIESLPDEQIYQVLDYIEFLESKYATAEAVEASGLQKFAEGLENKLRRKAVSPSTIREAFQLISAADRVLSGVSSAGRQILNDLNQAIEAGAGDDGANDVQQVEADPRKARSTVEGSPRTARSTVEGASGPVRADAGSDGPDGDDPPAAEEGGPV